MNARAGLETPQAIDLERLLKLRLVVARNGEKDNARWWNTDRFLGPLGPAVLRRGFPRTFRFAQARAVFTVAAHRCQETYDPPGAVTLWKLPAEIEEQFANRWSEWLDEVERWEPFFAELEKVQGTNLLGSLRRFQLLPVDAEEQANKLRRSAENRAVALPPPAKADDHLLTLRRVLPGGAGELGRTVRPTGGSRMSNPSRTQVVSSFTIIKGALLDETYAAFRHWDLMRTKAENLQHLRAANTVGARSTNWLRDVSLVLSRRFDADGRDRPSSNWRRPAAITTSGRRWRCLGGGSQDATSIRKRSHDPPGTPLPLQRCFHSRETAGKLTSFLQHHPTMNFAWISHNTTPSSTSSGTSPTTSCAMSTSAASIATSSCR